MDTAIAYKYVCHGHSYTTGLHTIYYYELEFFKFMGGEAKRLVMGPV